MATISRSSTPRGSRARAAQAQVQVEHAPRITTTERRAPQAVLHLRGATREEEVEATANRDAKSKRRIQWDESVVDNEGLGRKSSKVCCIYHAPRGLDESSDESSSDSDSDDGESDADDDGSARPPRRDRHQHEHGHGHSHDHGHEKRKGNERARSPNAYEKIPTQKSSGNNR